MDALFFHNLNDIPYMLAREMRAAGHDVRLMAKEGMGVTLYDVPGSHGDAHGGAPWIYTWKGGRGAFRNLRTLWRMRRRAEDLGFPVIASGSLAKAFYGTRLPLAVWLHGLELKYMSLSDGPAGWLMNGTIRRADLVISNQPDQKDDIRRHRIGHKVRYVPTPIHCGFWRQAAPVSDMSTFRVLAPATHDFAYKGTDEIIRGFAMFAKGCGPARPAFMTMRTFGPDLARSARLILELGITGQVDLRPAIPVAGQPADLEGHDCVIDSVARGIIGMVALEGMAMGRPVVCHAPADHYAKHYEPGDMPPLLQARTASDIAAALRAAYDGHAPEGSRDWVLRYHDAPVVARRLLEVLEDWAPGLKL